MLSGLGVKGWKHSDPSPGVPCRKASGRRFLRSHQSLISDWLLSSLRDNCCYAYIESYHLDHSCHASSINKSMRSSWHLSMGSVFGQEKSQIHIVTDRSEHMYHFNSCPFWPLTTAIVFIWTKLDEVCCIEYLEWISQSILLGICTPCAINIWYAWSVCRS